MAEIFGAGLTHYPALIAPDEDKMYPLLRTLKNDERLPESLKDPMNWPEGGLSSVTTTAIPRLRSTVSAWWPGSER